MTGDWSTSGSEGELSEGESESESSFSEESIALEQESWYHGFLPKDEVNTLLSNEGDFVVRMTEINRQEKFVISAKAKDGIKHFLINQTRENYFYLERKLFESIPLLIRFYTNSKDPLTTKSGLVLKTPVLRQSWELSHDQIQLSTKIGEGAFGEVFKGTLKWAGNQLDVAVKKCRGKMIPLEERMKFMREARIMRQFSHANIIRVHGVAAQQEPLMIAMELAPAGSLLSYIRKSTNQLSAKEKVRLCREVAEGMEYLEAHGCIHRDLAARNCLLGKNKEVKITDFGLSKDKEKFYKTAGTEKVPVRWLAPETLTEGLYSSKSDSWSFGVLMWEIFSNGKEPYVGMTTADVQNKVGSQGYKMTPPPCTPEAVAKLMVKCWETNGHKRPSFQAIRKELETIEKGI